MDLNCFPSRVTKKIKSNGTTSWIIEIDKFQMDEKKNSPKLSRDLFLIFNFFIRLHEFKKRGNKIWFSICCDLNDNENRENEKVLEFFYTSSALCMHIMKKRRRKILLNTRKKVEFQLKLWLKLMEKSKDLYIRWLLMRCILVLWWTSSTSANLS